VPRSMWKGVISFGMVSIPVRLYLATESHSTSFRQLCREHLSPIRYRRWCAAGDHEVPFSEVVRGYEVGRDSYVVIEDSDLDNLPIPTAHAIEISEFVPADQLEGGLYFKSAYYTEPEQAGLKPYQLLRQALRETDMCAVARIAFRDREHLCTLKPLDGMLLLNTLHWPDEIRSAAELRGLTAEAEVSSKELQMARSLIQSLAEDRFDPARYQDRYHQALMEVVERKLGGQEVVAAPAEEVAPKVMDLMEALRASVEQARRQKAERAQAERPARPRRAASAG
jgi:DNA end-binding protein Ku